eukprot:gene4365-1668_t
MFLIDDTPPARLSSTFRIPSIFSESTLRAGLRERSRSGERRSGERRGAESGGSGEGQGAEGSGERGERRAAGSGGNSDLRAAL